MSLLPLTSIYEQIFGSVDTSYPVQVALLGRRVEGYRVADHLEDEWRDEPGVERWSDRLGGTLVAFRRLFERGRYENGDLVSGARI